VELPLPRLAAPAQLRNAATAIAALRALHRPVPKAAIAQGIATAHVPGRMQRFEREHVTIVLDVAHNPQAAGELAQWLLANPIPGRTFAVFAALGDKDLHGVVAALNGQVDGWLLAGIDDAGPRGLAVGDFAHRLAGTDAADGAAYATAREALPAALEQAAPGDRILVFGSFHTVAAALQVLRVQD
jgi:dihydrofolate synthase/folylpolyglutamate synthase